MVTPTYYKKFHIEGLETTQCHCRGKIIFIGGGGGGGVPNAMTTVIIQTNKKEVINIPDRIMGWMK